MIKKKSTCLLLIFLISLSTVVSNGESEDDQFKKEIEKLKISGNLNKDNTELGPPVTIKGGGNAKLSSQTTATEVVLDKGNADVTQGYTGLVRIEKEGGRLTVLGPGGEKNTLNLGKGTVIIENGIILLMENTILKLGTVIDNVNMYGEIASYDGNTKKLVVKQGSSLVVFLYDLIIKYSAEKGKDFSYDVAEGILDTQGNDINIHNIGQDAISTVNGRVIVGSENDIILAVDNVKTTLTSRDGLFNKVESLSEILIGYTCSTLYSNCLRVIENKDGTKNLKINVKDNNNLIVDVEDKKIKTIIVDRINDDSNVAVNILESGKLKGLFKFSNSLFAPIISKGDISSVKTKFLHLYGTKLFGQYDTVWMFNQGKEVNLNINQMGTINFDPVFHDDADWNNFDIDLLISGLQLAYENNDPSYDQRAYEILKSFSLSSDHKFREDVFSQLIRKRETAEFTIHFLRYLSYSNKYFYLLNNILESKNGDVAYYINHWSENAGDKLLSDEPCLLISYIKSSFKNAVIQGEARNTKFNREVIKLVGYDPNELAEVYHNQLLDEKLKKEIPDILSVSRFSIARAIVEHPSYSPAKSLEEQIQNIVGPVINGHKYFKSLDIADKDTKVYLVAYESSKQVMGEGVQNFLGEIVGRPNVKLFRGDEEKSRFENDFANNDKEENVLLYFSQHGSPEEVWHSKLISSRVSEIGDVILKRAENGADLSKLVIISEACYGGSFFAGDSNKFSVGDFSEQIHEGLIEYLGSYGKPLRDKGINTFPKAIITAASRGELAWGSSKPSSTSPSKSSLVPYIIPANINTRTKLGVSAGSKWTGEQIIQSETTDIMSDMLIFVPSQHTTSSKEGDVNDGLILRFSPSGDFISSEIVKQYLNRQKTTGSKTITDPPQIIEIIKGKSDNEPKMIQVGMVDDETKQNLGLV